MITLDSASGYIDIPKANTYEELMTKIKKVLQINDELYKYLYFSYIDEEDKERTRLIPQIYDDFINQESPKLSIGFLDNINNKIMEQFNDIIELNKKRFKEEKEKQLIKELEDKNEEIILMKKQIEEEENEIDNIKEISALDLDINLNSENNINPNINNINNENKNEDIIIIKKKENDIEEINEDENIKNDIIMNSYGNKYIDNKDIIITSKKHNKENEENEEDKKEDEESKEIKEIIILENKENDENKENKVIQESEEIIEKEEIKGINAIQDSEEINEILIKENKENDEIEAIKIIQETEEIKDNKEIKENKENINNNDNILNINKGESDNCFTLFNSDSNNELKENINSDNINKENNNIIINNNKENEDIFNSEFNLKAFEKEFSNKFNNLQESMKNSNFEEYNKNNKNEENEFENNVKQIIEVNIDNMKKDILNSVLLEKPLKELKQKKSKVVHNGIKCDNCGMDPIIGVRYKCMECDNLNFCEKCEENVKHQHLFYKIKKNNLLLKN